MSDMILNSITGLADGTFAVECLNQAVVVTPEIYGVFDIGFNQGLNFYC